MPIWLNEPISMLQRIAEITCYYKIMEDALNEKDPVKRTGLVACFLISQYSEVFNRSRKPFNPLLGETYEIITPNFRFISEQVSHHPPVSAFHLEGPGYQMSGDTVVSSFFKGTSLEFRAVGLNHIILTETNEHITFKRPDNSANNILYGTLYVDVHGEVEVINVTKKIKVNINISRQGTFTSQAALRKLVGKVKDENGIDRFEINGKWSDYLSFKDLATGEEKEIFRAIPRPPQSERMYNFGYYQCNLNYIDDEMRKSLPPTDSRRRPDQRLMEEGDYDKASLEKHRLEEKQRAVRKQREKEHFEYKCKYFEQVTDEFSNETMYKFNGTYWEKRKKMDYADLPDIY